MTENESRIRLLEAADQLMIAQGYAATGVGEICRRAEVSKGGFYHCFESKQHCAIEMLRYHMDQAEVKINEGLDLTGVGEVEAGIRFVEHMQQIAEDVFQHGCLIGAFALELAESHPDLQRELSQIFRGITDQFEAMLTPLVEACPRPDKPSARELAEQMLMSIEGGVVLSKAYRDVHYVSQGLRLFRHYLETLCPSKAASP